MKGKTVLITGSSIGIGAATAKEFAKAKANVIITYQSDKKEAQKVAADCEKLGAAVLVLQLDVTDLKSIKTCVSDAVKKFKKIDILINNAGIIVWKNFCEQTPAEIAAQVNVNLTGLMHMTLLALPHVTDTIINIASMAGKHPHATIGPYCATKYGVRGFTQTLAVEEKKLKIYSVNPGMTATRMTDFEGVAPEKVAKIILNTAAGKYKLHSGSEVDVPNYL